MPESETFQTSPRDFAVELVENGLEANTLIIACLKYMSHDDVRDMLDCNELSPRFNWGQNEIWFDFFGCEFTIYFFLFMANTLDSLGCICYNVIITLCFTSGRMRMDDYDYDYDLGEFYDDGRYDDDPNPYHGTYSED